MRTIDLTFILHDTGEEHRYTEMSVVPRSGEQVAVKGRYYRVLEVTWILGADNVGARVTTTD